MSWQRIRGHEQIVAAFAQARRRGRLGHAYLFTGPGGIGKRLFAGELAKTLLCEATTPTTTPWQACDRCSSCRLLDAGTHADFFTLSRPEDSHEVPIELMRELCRGFALKSARGQGKVAILDDADDLNEASANCFLKTLEEPPPRSVFFLIGTSAERQLPTVVSRCQVVPFAPLPEPLTVAVLLQQGVTDEALARRLARFAEGSPGLALTLAEPSLWDFRRSLLQGLTQTPPDTVNLARSFQAFVEEAGKESARQRQRAALVLHLVLAFLKEALALSLGGTPAAANSEDLPLLRNLVNRAEPEKIMQLLERCLEAEFHLERYLLLNLVLEGFVDALGQIIMGSKR